MNLYALATNVGWMKFNSCPPKELLKQIEYYGTGMDSHDFCGYNSRCLGPCVPTGNPSTAKSYLKQLAKAGARSVFKTAVGHRYLTMHYNESSNHFVQYGTNKWSTNPCRTYVVYYDVEYEGTRSVIGFLLTCCSDAEDLIDLDVTEINNMLVKSFIAECRKNVEARRNATLS